MAGEQVVEVVRDAAGQGAPSPPSSATGGAAESDWRSALMSCACPRIPAWAAVVRAARARRSTPSAPAVVVAGPELLH